MLVSYTWLQEEYFDNKLPAVDEVAEALLAHSFEIEGVEEKDGDAVIDIDVLPNRAHDCLSHRGIAREISLILGIPFSEKTVEATFENVEATLRVDVQEKNLCNRYIGRVIKNIEVKDSPDWLKRRLEVLGQRSINALVDATNYVLLDIGQPTHVFDLDKLDEKEITVRTTRGGEFATLGDDKVVLEDGDLVIANKDNELAIAGIKGGQYAEVTKETKNIVLESGHFDPVAVRKTSRRLGILTDSSKRFENEHTIALTPEAMEYLTRLVVNLCGTSDTIVEYAVDSNKEEVEEKKVLVETGHINKLLGVTLADAEVADIFNRFGWDYQKMGDEFTVHTPDERLDIDNAADLVEEVGRIYGYKNVPSLELPLFEKQSVNKEFYYVTKIKQVLIESGFSEVYTQSFVSKGELEMSNPVGKDKPYLRASIDLSEVYDMNVRNKDLLGVDEVKIFEIGKVFVTDGSEKLLLSLKTEKKLAENPLEVFDIHVESDAMSIDLEEVIEKLPEIVSYDELYLEEVEPKQYKTYSAYPFVTRDIAVWLPESTPKEELEALIQGHAGELLVREPRLVDEYAKDGKVSYAYRIVFQSLEKTLTDKEVGEIMKNIESAVAEKGWEVR